MKEPRDSQRGRVYKCDDVANRHWDNRRIETVPELQAFANLCFTHPDIRAKYGKTVRKFAVVRDGRRCRRALGGPAGIQMPRWSRTLVITCHELAHTITIRHYGRGVQAHGVYFCEAYLDLIKAMGTAFLYETLKTAFDEHGVHYRGH
jgi:hypothetical protein